uniref:ribosomal protein S2 n=1 Tax=Dictyotopsis propagulifera TaxID=670095 RepID=UPI002E77789D|nr:ribosomal protein S2 [Dictyotopsis propagulifera]WBP69941.1 ribosomal protein S2 [Dictyotopsis propagulifera]
MRYFKNKIKEEKIIFFLLNHKAYLGPTIKLLDKSVFSFFLGKRNQNSYYSVNSSYIYIKISLKLLSKIVSKKGKIYLVGGTIPFVALLLYLSIPKYFYVYVYPWKFSQIKKSSKIDFFILHEICKKSILESENKNIPFIGVNCFVSNNVPYPFPISLENNFLKNWYLYCIISSFKKGLYYQKKKVHEI